MGVARASVHVDGKAARALLLSGMERVSATGGTIGFMLEVGALAEEVCVRRGGRGWLMAVQRPLQLGTINVLPVEGASSLLRDFESPSEVGNGDCRQQADDGHDNHNFEECESGLWFCFHGVPDRSCFHSSKGA